MARARAAGRRRREGRAARGEGVPGALIPALHHVVTSGNESCNGYNRTIQTQPEEAYP
ncbi:protein of unknown function [Burkholderia multivorans]